MIASQAYTENQVSIFGDLTRKTAVVLFAGGGGACLGLKWAGFDVISAINHNAHAIALHTLNFPDTQHFREDVRSVHPVKAMRGRRVDLIWMSPDCRHFSIAKGSSPVTDSVRSLADSIWTYLDEMMPAMLLLENVKEFLTWGPTRDGKPIKERAGEYFKAWIARLEAYGYVVDWRILAACDYGVPTSRQRLYLVARRDRQAIVWPKPTHGYGLLPYHTANECIDRSIPWSRDLSVKPLTSMHRVEHGLKNRGKDFLISYYGTGLSNSLQEPMPTVTTKDRFGLISWPYFRMLTPKELASAMGFPESYKWIGSPVEQKARIGNAVCPKMAEVITRANT